MEARTVRLHGGPWHSRVTVLPADRDHFHILEFDPSSPVEPREGTYSRVLGHPYDFEWDGWVSHD